MLDISTGEEMGSYLNSRLEGVLNSSSEWQHQDVRDFPP